MARPFDRDPETGLLLPRRARGAHRLETRAHPQMFGGMGNPVWQGVLNTPLADPYWANVVLLLLGDSMTDRSAIGQSPTYVGTAPASSGGVIVTTGGTTGYAKYDYAFADATSSPFTIEYFVEFTGTSADLAPVWARYAVAGMYDSAFTALAGDGGYGTPPPTYYAYNGIYNTVNPVTAGWVANELSRHHVAFVRKSGVNKIEIFVNGYPFTYATTAAELGRFTFGCLNGTSAWTASKFDNIRITKGVCRYDPTGSTPGVQQFVPPTTPFPTA